jgi:hypothetical protein
MAHKIMAMIRIPFEIISYSAMLLILPKRAKGILLCILCVFPGAFLSLAEAGSNVCPAEYGKTLYECNPTQEKQLFIIGMGHRDALTGANAPRTARIQAEVYKIGEWLIRRENVELILPEGFFKSAEGNKASSTRADSEKRKAAEAFDLRALEEKLSATGVFINAEILWKRNYAVTLQQVENRECYEGVGALIAKLAGGCSAEEYKRTRASLDSLQERRTEVMLQRIPEIIEREYKEGRIRTHKAIFTIGLSHLFPILNYLSEGRGRFSPLPAERNDYQPPDLRQENYRVSVLLPRSLAEDPKTLEINGLGKNLFGSSFPKANSTSSKNRER